MVVDEAVRTKMICLSPRNSSATDHDRGCTSQAASVEEPQAGPGDVYLAVDYRIYVERISTSVHEGGQILANENKWQGGNRMR